MRITLIASVLLLNAGISSSQVRPISDLHQNNSSGVPTLLNSVVQVEGIVTVSDQFIDHSFVQDSSGGVGVFDSAFVSSVQIGDTLIITGQVTQFNGLTRLINVTIDSVVGVGGAPEYLVITAADIEDEGNGGVENLEGRLIRLNGASLSEYKINISTLNIGDSCRLCHSEKNPNPPDTNGNGPLYGSALDVSSEN